MKTKILFTTFLLVSSQVFFGQEMKTVVTDTVKAVAKQKVSEKKAKVVNKANEEVLEVTKPAVDVAIEKQANLNAVADKESNVLLMSNCLIFMYTHSLSLPLSAVCSFANGFFWKNCFINYKTAFSRICVLSLFLLYIFITFLLLV